MTAFILKVKRFLSWLYEYFTIKDDLKIKYKDLKRDLKKQFPLAEYIDISDSTLYPIYQTDMEKVLTFNVARLKEYKTDAYDCEDFSYVLNGLMRFSYSKHAFGTCKVRLDTGGLHRLCCFINEFGQFMFIEPQTNSIFKPDTVPKWTVLDILL